MSEISELMTLCKEADLEGYGILELFTEQALSEIYNGIGPDRFPEWLRAMLTKANGLFAPAALIHDVRYHVGGTYDEFTASNSEFRENCLKLVRARYGWYDPRRYIWTARALRYAEYCQIFGWKGFNCK